MATQSQNDNRGVIWLKKTGFDFDVIDASVPLNHQFVPGIFSYLEVFDEEKLGADIDGFIKQNNVSPCHLILVFDREVVFDKESDITANSPQPQEDKQQFLDLVPFENIYSKTWTIDNKSHLIVVNAESFDCIKSIFEKSGFLIISAIPYFLAGKNSLDQTITRALWNDIDSIRHQSIIPVSTVVQGQSTANTGGEKPKHSRREIYLIIIFSILLLIFGIFVYLQFIHK
jgi:hypothetical protein